MSGRTTAPGRLALAEWIDSPIARVHRLATGVGEGQAFTEDADALDDDGVGSDSRSRGEATREPAAEGRAVEHVADGDDASRHRRELGGRFAVEKTLRTTAAAVAAGEQKDGKQKDGPTQPVQPHLATPP